MSRTSLPNDIVEYPCSDGQPMAETPVHGDCMMYVTMALRRWFGKHGRDDVYVGSNNFLYYEQGNPRAVVAPDVYVVVGAPSSPPRDSGTRTAKDRAGSVFASTRRRASTRAGR